ncbi:TetR/AcrR family transcriptional regulator [Nocardia veterana]|uniref:TetR/AcrR family transcriptional regulator n=1 Tax=Nocardia veterana TaxID=132249 RepID=A0A7X6M1G2_9NOCA|nr:TetR/AcrR family transcriptional regulator [Nocardia veterana]NKY87582.1 TetR/AcrR family transcriptional regulator [Nocardia veterana]
MTAAAAVFAAYGYHDTSMDEIAGRVCISKPILYKSFSSKHELYLVVLRDAAEKLARGLSEALCWAAVMGTVASATVVAYFDFVDDYPHCAQD